MVQSIKTDSVVQKERLYWVDYAKLIGIFFVVLGHVLSGVSSFELLAWIFSFHMPLFFILAGYFCNKNDSVLTTVKKGFRSLLVPYFFFFATTFLLGLLVLSLSDSSFWDSISIRYVLHRSFMALFIGEGQDSHFSASHNSALWFLVALFFCKVIVQFVFENKDNLKRNLIILSLVSAFVTYILIYHRINLLFSMDSTIMCVPFFIFGYFFRQFDYKRDYRLLTKIMLALVFFLLGYILNVMNREGTVRVDINRFIYGSSLLVFYINGIVGSLAIVFFAKLFSNLCNRFLLYLGQNTIIILGYHLLGIICIQNILFDKVLRGIYPAFNLNFFCLEDIVISILVILLCLIPIYIIRKYFPFIIGISKNNIKQ